MIKHFFNAGQLLLAIIICSKVYSQENPEKLRQLQLANQGNPPGTPSGNQAAKIEATKGAKTLPPGINTTNMVAEQYNASGTLRPYQPLNTSSGPTSTFVPTPSAKGPTSKTSNATGTKPVETPAVEKNLKSKSSPLSTSVYEQPNSPFGSSSAKLPAGGSNSLQNPVQTSTSSLSNQLPTNFPNSSGSTTPLPNGTTRGVNGAAGGNQYDKVPYLLPANTYNAPPVTGSTNSGQNQYNAPPRTGADNNPYGSLQKLPQGQVSNSVYGTAPKTGNVQQSTNTYHAPPVIGVANSAQNQYDAPPRTGVNNNPYGSLQKIPQGQASNSVYSTGPTTGNAKHNNNSSQSSSLTGTNVGTGNQNFAPPASSTNNNSNTGVNNGVPASTPNLNKNTSPSNQNQKVETRKKMGTKG